MTKSAISKFMPEIPSKSQAGICISVNRLNSSQIWRWVRKCHIAMN